MKVVLLMSLLSEMPLKVEPPVASDPQVKIPLDHNNVSVSSEQLPSPDEVIPEKANPVYLDAEAILAEMEPTVYRSPEIKRSEEPVI